MKKIVCLVLSLLMILSSVSVFAAFSDVDEKAIYVDAVSALNQLGIINGYPDGTFKPEQNVTRAEFTAMLMRTMGYGNIGTTSAEALPFTDISADDSDISWAIPNIVTAYGMGIINGYEDGTFLPNENVKFEEAIKMVVCGLGYGKDVSVDVEPWYVNYMSIASKLGITQRALSLGGTGTPASRACIAQILYDSLEVSVVENDVVTEKNLLTNYLGYVKNTGYIAANDVTSLTSPDVNLRENQIQIRAKEPNSNKYEVHTYEIEDAQKFKDKLGYQVEYFYDANSRGDIRKIFSCELKGNNILELNSNSIDEEASTDNQIKYLKEGAKTTTNVNLASDNIVIYNGKLYGSSAESSSFDTSMLPEVGTVSLLDSNTDGKYDIVTIYDYDVYYVSVKSTAEKSIVDNVTKLGADEKKLKLDIDDSALNLSIVDKDGKEVSYSSIAVGNVICFAENNNNGGSTLQTAIVLKDSVSGEVSEKQTGEAVTINDKTYDFSNAAPWIRYADDSSALTEPDVGTTGKFVLDILGNIVYYTANDEESTTKYSYGYIMGYNKPKNAFSDDFQIRVLDQSSSKPKDLYIYKNTTIYKENADGKWETLDAGDSDDLLDILKESAQVANKDADAKNLSIQQVIKYTTRSYKGNECVDKIIVAAERSTGGDVENSKLNFFAPSANSSLKYSSGKLSNSNVTLNVSSSIVFVVPSDRLNYDDYKKSTASSSFRSNAQYSVEAFDVSKANSAKVIVLYGASSAADVDSVSPLYLVKSIVEENNSDEDAVMYKISGVKINQKGSAANFTEWISTESKRVAEDLEVGSIFRAGTDKDGYLTIQREHIIYPTDKSFSAIEDTTHGTSWNKAEYVVIYGSVYASEDGDVRIVVPSGGKFLEEGTIIEDIEEEESYTISTSDFSGKVYTYDTSGRKLEILDNDAEAATAALTYYTDGAATPSKVLLYMSEGKVKLFIVME